MKWKNPLVYLGFLVLVFDSRTAVQGAAAGIGLCVRRVVPSLFPFLFLSSLLMEGGMGLGWAASLFGLPKSWGPMMVPAFLGGYPVGAQCLGLACREGRITKEDGERLLLFCSNAGPAFLFGIVAGQFPQPGYALKIWAVQLLSAWTVARFAGSVGGFASGRARAQSPLGTSIRAMENICGWIVLFRVLIAFLERWVLWLLPDGAAVVCIGLLELSNGCCRLRAISDVGLRFVAANGLLCFGGICVLCQTASVIAPLKMGRLLIGKVIQTGVALLLSLAVAHGLWPLLPVWVILVLGFSAHIEKKSSILRAAAV